MRDELADQQSNVALRKATRDDLGRLEQLIREAGLPAAFIEENLGGFFVAEVDGLVLACGGLETYSDTGVLRSFAVAEQSRRHRLGTRITERILAEAASAGLRDVYLFTIDAWPFWLRCGFSDLPIDDWREPARECWQYQYVSTHAGEFEGLHSMWRSLA